MVELLKESGGLRALAEFDNHHFIGFFNDPAGLESFIVIHRKSPLTPSFGATRLRPYESPLAALRDALRLSRMMSYKAALAGLQCGGAKGVIRQKSGGPERQAALKSYAEAVNFLQGQFVTGADVGLDQADLLFLKKTSPYFAGLNQNPAEATALGLYYAIQVCFEEVFGSKKGRRTFAVQGLGKVGRSLIKLLYPEAKKIFVADLDPEKVRLAKKEYPKIAPVGVEEIHTQAVDVFCPCALGQILNSRTLAVLRCRMVVGGANNQLDNEETGELLWKLGILYAPDYVVNAGGLISAVDEFESKNFNRKRVEKKIARIKKTLSQILKKSRQQNRATNLVANELAEKVFNSYR